MNYPFHRFVITTDLGVKRQCQPLVKDSMFFCQLEESVCDVKDPPVLHKINDGEALECDFGKSMPEIVVEVFCYHTELLHEVVPSEFVAVCDTITASMSFEEVVDGNVHTHHNSAVHEYTNRIQFLRNFFMFRLSIKMKPRWVNGCEKLFFQ